MPIFGFLFFLIYVFIVGTYTLKYILRYVKTREVVYLKKLALVWMAPFMLLGLAFYAHFPITKERIVGTYRIDTSFYPGKNADWQREIFYFEITKDDQFQFHEKLKDGSYKTIQGRIEWYRQSPPMLYRIVTNESHPLIDEYPALYRGNRKFYYVFESKFGDMFYRKVK